MKKIIMNIGYYDELWLRNRIMSEQDIDDLIGLCASHGVDRVQLRITSPLGRYLYRTQRPNRMVFDRDQYMRSGDCDCIASIESDREKAADSQEWILRIAIETLERFDPMVVAREAARKKGIEFYLWLDPFDDYIPGYLNDFFVQNPHCQWTSRDGRHRFKFLRSYAFPEAREHFLGYLREMLSVRPDGVYLSTSCHAQHCPRPSISDFYGFEAPVVARYQERHSVDIRESPQLDCEAWHRIKGEFMTEFYRQVKEELQAVGAKLSIGSQLGDYTGFRYPFANSYHRVSARYHNDWRRWVDDGIADSLVIGDYQSLWDTEGFFRGYWDGFGEPVASAERPADVAAEVYAEHCKGKCELYYFSGWMHKPQFPQCLEIRKDTLHSHPADGLVVHEAMSIEEADAWEQVSQLA